MSRTDYLREIFTQEDIAALGRAMDRGSRAASGVPAIARERITVGVTLSVAAIEKLQSDQYAIVPEHIFRLIVARLHQLATDGLDLTDSGAVVDGGDNDARLPEGVESCSPGVWVHDDEMPHPCEYACGAVYVERGATEPDEHGDVEPTYKLEVGTWSIEL
jgi:hypothetical protein